VILQTSLGRAGSIDQLFGTRLPVAPASVRQSLIPTRPEAVS